jgi:hypothetical protein
MAFFTIIDNDVIRISSLSFTEIFTVCYYDVTLCDFRVSGCMFIRRRSSQYEYLLRSKSV